MKSAGLVVLMTVMVSLSSFGQSYTTAIGVKGGFPGYGSLNLKHDFGGVYGDFAIGGSNNWLSFSALAEKQSSLGQGFDWYAGIGLYMYSWRNDYVYHGKYYNNGAQFGIQAVLGLEYTFNEIPINLAADVGPAISVSPYFGPGWVGNVAIRYVLK